MSDDAANRMPETEVDLVKAHFLGAGRDGTESSNVLRTPEEEQNVFRGAGIVPPPLDLMSLAHLYEMSGALRSNIDAYSVNIDSFGHRFEPLIDFSRDDARERVKLAMMQEALLGLGAADNDVDKVISLLGKRVPGFQATDRLPDPGAMPEPSDAEVDLRIESIKREMIREKLAVEKFFAFCTIDESFEMLRMKTRQDRETIGNAYWEVLRNSDSDIVQFNYVPGFSVRVMPSDRAPQTVMMPMRATLITPVDEPVQKRFRRFVQISNGAMRASNLIWFKEFGDVRVYSAVTGLQYPSGEELERREPGVPQATELIHFRTHNARSPYGVPRWISEMLAVVGSRHAEEINLAYFENKSVPPLAVLVSGGRLVKEDVTRLENFITNEIRGKKNFHKIMILQAETGDSATAGLSSGRCKIELKPLTNAQHDDAQFMKYMERNTDMIGSVFRLPRLLRGDARDFNRSTAQTSLEFTEQQVFAPLRKDFDYFINRCVLPELGVNYWRFVSKGPDFSDPTSLLEALHKTAEAGYLTPAELRDLAERGFGVDFAKIDADWTTRPLPLTLAGISTAQVTPGEASAGKDEVIPVGDSEDSHAGEDNDLAKEAARLVKLHKLFSAAAFNAAKDAADAE